MKLKNILCATICLLWLSHSHAIVGCGIHWGMDLSLNMKDVSKQSVGFGTLLSPTTIIDSFPGITSFLPAGINSDSLKKLIIAHQTIFLDNSPITISRSNWARSNMNIGGKVYVDFLPIVPLINSIELSFNIGAWEYDGVINYPNGQLQPNLTAADINTFVSTGNYEKLFQMKQLHMTLENLKLDYKYKLFGITKTPFTRFHFDLSFKKDIISLPPIVTIFKLYAGLGPSIHYATPLLSPTFIRKSLTTAIQNSSSKISSLSTGINESMMQNVLKDMIKESKKPVVGMHFIAGTRIKLPIIPLGFYVDGKYLIPFSDISEGADLETKGLLLNAGILLGI